MSTNIPSVAYTYPIPECFNANEVKAMTIPDLSASIEEAFGNYETIRNNLLAQLNRIFGSAIPLDEEGHISLTDFIKNVSTDCDESNTAYKFYGCQIIAQINKLSDYINEAKAILEKWNTLSGNDLSSLVHSDVVRLESLEQFCYEIHKKFGSRYYYDFDEDNWKLAEDDYSSPMHYEQIGDGDDYGTYDALYQTTVKCNKKTAGEKILGCFNEINLLDRLKYIKVYYDIKNGKTNYVFPGSKEVGYPCVAEDGIEETDARIANLEKFYLGYLIDRDGPVNAFCSLYEVKVRALQETLNEMSNRIKALNVYMDFINRGLDLLNQSQSDKGKHRIPDGAIHALTYLCGQDMYNLYIAPNGGKYLVLPVLEKGVPKGEYNLFLAEEAGKKALLGDECSSGNNYAGNGSLVCDTRQNPRGWKYRVEPPPKIEINLSIGTELSGKYGIRWGNNASGIVGDKLGDTGSFELPKKLEVATIDPRSAKNYTIAHRGDLMPDLSDDDHKATMESWTAAFNKKIGFIDDAIKLINTDIEQIRNKIDTYQSQANTFRNRVHDVYVNTVRKIKS